MLPLLGSAALAGCGGDGSARPTSGAPARPPAGAASPTGPAADPAGAPRPSRRQDAISALTTLRRYTSALSAEDAGGLQATLAPAVRVYVKGGGACSVLAGRQAVVTGYAAQFTGPSASYAFARSRRADLALESGGAKATLRERRPRAKTVQVHLRRVGAAWQIDQVGSACGGAHGTGPAPSEPGAPAPRPGRDTPARQGKPRVVHPRPGCTVVLDPQGPGGAGSKKPPDRKALDKLCRSGSR